ncbi:MAG: tyrosine-protein phosphatase [Chloroflexi bacterium]|nr:tyrosine-protein phosphatase [Chloroflexota bacterium]
MRNPDELERRPNVFRQHERVRYHHAPLRSVPANATGHERLATLDFRAHYIEMVRDSGETFAFIFHLLADEANYPLVFHCAGGRDRTGVAAALILLAAGVPRDHVIVDYMLSKPCIVPREEMYAERLRQQGIDPEPVLRNTMLRESFIEGVLDVLDADCGGIERYLAALGITPDELRALRASFVEPA